MGIEQELFLLRGSERPCRLFESQLFFDVLLQNEWTGIFAEGPSGISMITQVFIMAGSIRLEIKYEHDPHIIEITAGPSSNLHLVNEAIQFCWNAVAHAAQTIGLFVDTKPHRPDLRILEPRSRQIEALIFYRKKLLGEMNPDAYFSDTIISTHIHIGGLPWIDRPHLIEKLYLQEPSVHLVLDRDTGLQDSRWLKYRQAFEAFPLVGFPDLTAWTIDEWASSLCQMPLMDPHLGVWAGKTTAKVPRAYIQSTFPLIRDFQIVKPRSGGTIEFRASRAQPSVARVLSVAALRLGIASVCLAGDLPDGSFQGARQLWWSQVLTGIPSADDRALEFSLRGLRLRELGEEQFLLPIQCIGSQDSDVT